jgi:hypothetical protein
MSSSSEEEEEILLPVPGLSQVVTGSQVENEPIEEEPNKEPLSHWTVAMKEAAQGKQRGIVLKYFTCCYCPKSFQGPSTGTVWKHLRSKHPKKCPGLSSSSVPASRTNRGFFDKKKMSAPFNPDVFMGKLLKWIVKTDQPFSVVDNVHFEDLLDYLKKVFFNHLIIYRTSPSTLVELSCDDWRNSMDSGRMS